MGSTAVNCETNTCQGEAAFRFTWPGRNEMHVCARCAARAVGVAEAMGFDLECKPLPSPKPESDE